ncbi:MAG: hypothetical protein LC747_05790 [Acidobacteria bacterium]|nr:hypothetical protein [Acidobacteriota bacterium]
MAPFEGKTPAERNKLIAAIAFGALALLLLGRMFFSSDTTPPRRTSNSTNRNSKVTTTANAANGDSQLDGASDPTLQIPQELNPQRVSYSVPDAGRNIFAFYVAPVKAITQTVLRGEFADKEKRFKVTSISTRAVELTDVNLQIKHTLPYVENRASGGPPSGPSPRNTPPVKPADDDDDEPQD